MHFLIEELGQELYNEDSACSEGASKTIKTSYAKSILNELKNIENFTDSCIEHIFEGNVKRGKAGGYHYESIKD